MVIYNPHGLPLPLEVQAAVDDAQALPMPKPARDANGRLLPGNSGNPMGRNTWAKSHGELRRLAREATEANVRQLQTIRDDPNQPAAARVAAIGILLDRGYGKATQPLEIGKPGTFDAMADEELDAYVKSRALLITQGGTDGASDS
jgi:hypothetical protein